MTFLANQADAPMSTTWQPGTVLDAATMFDSVFYLETNPGVAESGMEPYQHFCRHGAAEGRRPVSWFDPRWYAAQNLGGDVTEAFDHYCRSGNLLGLPPNAQIAATVADAAREMFDIEFYLRTNEDVSGTGRDPWAHFLAHGARESRNPAPDFNINWYINRYVRREISATKGPNPCNALLHYVAIGKERGYLTQPRTVRPVKPAPRAIPGLSADAALLYGSPWFNAEHYRNVSGQTASRADLVTHYLATTVETRLDPSPQFGGAFYRDRYGKLPKMIEELACPADMPPLLHFLKTGQDRGFYPNAQIASLEIETIRSSGRFEAEYYFSNLARRPVLTDLVADYVFYGHVEGKRPFPGFDGSFVRTTYDALLGDPMHAPLAFYLNNANRAWVLASEHELRSEAAAVRACPLFDAEAYIKLAGIEDTERDPAEHYVIEGVRSGLPTGPRFDTEFYLANNADLANARVNPMLHYHNHGRKEGRIGLPTTAEHPDMTRRTYDSTKPSVIIFTHEFSRTGAPIVALNMARKFGERYNVIVWSGQADGALIEEFGAVSVEMRSGWGSTSGMADTLRTLHEAHGSLIAVVNSVVCHPVVAPLRLAGIPSVALIHEFANYVYPFGTLSRMVLFSDAAVFPAKMVQDACVNELTRMGTTHVPAHLHIRPQGYNAANSGTPSTTAAQIRAQLALDEGPRQRVLFGAGQVQPRKGLDLFLQAAQQLQARGDYDWRFVWVGGGYDPSRDMLTSVYIQHQISESGLTERVFLYDEQSSLEPFWEVADVFFLSSRMDPFPNVALDAMERNLPVVCFAGGTGIAELEPEFPFAVRAVRFADPIAAADAISAFAAIPDQTEAAFKGETGRKLRRSLSFDTYVNDLETFGAAAGEHHEQVLSMANDLAQVAPEQVEQAIRNVPTTFRLSSVASPALNRLNLAALLTDRPLPMSLQLDKDAGILEVLSPAGGVCGADFGRAPSLLPPTEHLVHLHATDPKLIDALFSPKSWTARLLSACRLVITAQDRKTIAALRPTLPARVHLIDQAFADGFAAISHVLSQPASAFGGGSHAAGTLGAETFTHCEPAAIAGQPVRVGREVLDTLSALMSGAALQCLGDRPAVDAIVPALLQDDVTEAVRAAFAKAVGLGETPSTHAPGFMGTYRRAPVEAFLTEGSETISRYALGLNKSERKALAALLFAAKGAHLLPALRLHS
ncbi:MAG: glycosyltransferase [Gemmobacter sp.]|nr:glycosyltransferase [Gemmobacter sp.]